MPSLTTQLDAVNVILGAAGEQPVDSLDASTADAANASAILEEISREVQSEGWHFNTEEDVALVPNASKEIVLSSNILDIDVDPRAYRDIDPVQRGTKLYDKVSKTYAFSSPIKARVVYYLDFVLLPEQVRRFITIRSARVFHDRFVGDEVSHRFSENDELRARMNLEATQLANADINLFRSDPRLARGLSRS